MKWSYSIVGVIILGLFSLFILFLFEEATVANEQDYYNLKEITEASMNEAVDIAYYEDTGNVKIIQEKFIENFIRRFAQNQKLDNYSVEFYDIMEEPAKVTVRVSNDTDSYNIYGTRSQVKVVNEISGILDDKKNSGNQCTMRRVVYSSPYATETGSGSYNGQLKLKNWNGYHPISITYIGSWRDNVNDIPSTAAIIRTYLANKHNYFDTTDSGYDGIPESEIKVNTLAKISNLSVSLNGNVASQRFDYNCENRLHANVNGQSNVQICLLGTMYQVVYKKDNCN